MMKITLAAVAIATASPALASVMTPSQYVMTAGASDLFEQTSSKLVLETTQDPKVRAFANEMIADHGKSTAAVKAAAMKAGLKPAAPHLTPLQSEKVAELQSASGPDRDALYLAQQKAAHGQALAVQKAYAMDGTSAPLKAAAGGIVPVVEQHIAMLKTM
jgi:putative membrane protein